MTKEKGQYRFCFPHYDYLVFLSFFIKHNGAENKLNKPMMKGTLMKTVTDN